MPITRTPIIDDDGSGTSGTVIDNAWKQEFYNQIDAVAGGTWIDIPYNAADYTANTGTWTFNAAGLLTWRYCVVGRIVFFLLDLGGTHTLSAATFSLSIKLPTAVLPTKSISVPMVYYLPTVNGTGLFQIQPAATKLDMLRDFLGTTFPATAAQTCFFRAAWFYSIA